MRALDPATRLSGHSIDEVTVPLQEDVLRLGQSGLRFRGKRIKPGPLLNALVLEFLSLPPEERDRCARSGIARLELILAETDEERAAAESRLEKLGKIAPYIPGTKGVDDQPPAKRRGRRA